MSVSHELTGGCAHHRSLDSPELLRPAFHIFFGSRLGWFDTADHYPRHEAFRPDTRGL